MGLTEENSEARIGTTSCECEVDFAPMPIVFVIASDSKMRTAIRAELRERGIHALGMDSASDVAHSIGTGVLPDAVVLEATDELAGDIRIQNLLERVPAVLIVSRTVDLRVSLPKVAFVLNRPVRVEGIVERVRELVEEDHAI